MRLRGHSISLCGNRHPNEDLATVVGDTAWVLDGATGLHEGRLLPDGPTDAAAFVARLDREMRWLCAESGEPTLTWLLEQALKKIAGELAPYCRTVRDRVALPTAAVAMTRLEGDALEALVLGDCRVLVRDPLGLRADLQDGRVYPFDRKSVSALSARMAAGDRFEDARRAVEGLLREHRRMANVKGGYWAAGLDPSAARRARTLRIAPVEEGTEVLLMTDGFHRIIGMAVGSEDELMDLVAGEGLERAACLLRATEDADPECHIYPRLSPQDDASAVWLRVEHS